MAELLQHRGMVLEAYYLQRLSQGPEDSGLRVRGRETLVGEADSYRLGTFVLEDLSCRCR